MVTMVILMLLAVMAISTYRGTLERQRVRAAKLTMASIRAAFEVYNTNYEAYPCSSGCTANVTKIIDLTSLYSILSPQFDGRDIRRDFRPDGFVSYNVTPISNNRPTLYTLVLRSRAGTLITASPSIMSGTHGQTEVPMPY